MRNAETPGGGRLVLASCMAPICDQFISAVAGYLGQELDTEVQVLSEPGWHERERRFDAGLVDLCWICGLPYVRKVAERPGSVRLLAGPVMAGPRYAGRPVYYSDVIVRADQPAETLEQLFGLRWVYNEIGSHSGYSVFLAELARRGLPGHFLGESIEAGSHERALRLIVAGEADFGAIDSTVLELEVDRWPELVGLVRSVTTLGPSPIPPFLTAGHVPLEMHHRMERALLAMHESRSGREALALAKVGRMVQVADSQYDPIREADRLSATIRR